MLPYGKQYIDEEDINAVVDILRSDWLTTGPTIKAFEGSIAKYVGARFAVAVSSGTAALHSAMHISGIGPGDEVIVPAMTFAASANCIIYQGGTPVFADVKSDTLCVDPDSVKRLITPKTKALIAVDFAGHPCDYDALKAISDKHQLTQISDACHSLGAEYKGCQVGRLSKMTVFSFHPVKHITTGEGGMVVTEDEELFQGLVRFRNHGITTEFRQREEQKTWYYEMTDLGYNYRITDIQCALGISQLKKLPGFLKRRREIANKYNQAFAQLPYIHPPVCSDNVNNAWHLYVVKIDFKAIGKSREEIFNRLIAANIGVNVHYIPVHMHPYYRKNYSTHPGMCPVAESAYEQIMSLPLHPSMTDSDIDYVINHLSAYIDK